MFSTSTVALSAGSFFSARNAFVISTIAISVFGKSGNGMLPPSAPRTSNKAAWLGQH